MIRSASEAKAQLPIFTKGYVECKETLGKMSAKARGVRCHTGPVQLRAAWPARDCSSWVREDKQYHPYSYFEMPNNSPSPKPKKPPQPPRLWLPEKKSKDAGKKSSQASTATGTAPTATGTAPEVSLQTGGSSPSKASKVKPDAASKPDWDTKHHIMSSRLNDEVQAGIREYFDTPKMKESQGMPKVREQYAMHDRQCGWNDEPAELGEMRRTLFDNIGPFSLGGCKQQQLPSYWRKVKNWHAHSAPDLKAEGGLSGSRLPHTGDRSLLAALADAPASQTTEFWRGWAEATSKPGALPSTAYGKGWDSRFGVTWSKDNDSLNKRQREYFSVPHGKPGRPTEGRRSGKKLHDPYGTPQVMKD